MAQSETLLIDNTQLRIPASEVLVETLGGALVELGAIASAGDKYTNISPDTFSGGRVSAAGIGDYWGRVIAAGDGPIVVQVVPEGAPTPTHGVQNVQVSGDPSIVVGIGVSNYTSTGFTLTTNSAGTFYWRAVVV